MSLIKQNGVMLKGLIDIWERERKGGREGIEHSLFMVLLVQTEEDAMPSRQCSLLHLSLAQLTKMSAPLALWLCFPGNA